MSPPLKRPVKKYSPDILPTVRNYSYLGASDADLAVFLGVKEGTVANWRKRYPEFDAACREGKEDADARVAKSLYQRAIGFERADVTEHLGPDGKVLKVTKSTKYYPPEVSAAIYWLNNRQRNRWSNRPGEDGPQVIDVAEAISKLIGGLPS